MRIAVDARFLQAKDHPELSDFTREVFQRLSIQHTEHEFILFADSALDGVVGLPENVTTIAITPKPTNVFLYEWWYNVKLAFAVKRYKADVFVATYGLSSLTISIPTVLVVRDLAFLKTRAYYPENSYSFYKRNTAAYIRKASAIATLSDFVKEELVTKYKVNRQKVEVLGSGPDEHIKPITWEEREKIKEQFAEGWEYFVFTSSLNPRSNLLNLLKAFSIFKKWQKTNMKLIVADTGQPGFEREFEKLNLNAYKYRNEVFVKKGLTKPEVANIVAASYALIFPSFYEGFPVALLNAMSAEVPVISSANSSMSEIGGDAALYVNPASPEELAEQMKKIFKDEEIRNKLIEAGKARVKEFNWDKTADRLWKVTEQAVSK